MKQYLAALDRAAAQLNALLVVVAIGLAMLDITVLVSKGMMAAIAESMAATQAQISGFGYTVSSSEPGDPAAPRL